MLLEKMCEKETEHIPIRQQDGIHCIAFGFKEVLDGWAEKNEELAMDSTCKFHARIIGNNLIVISGRTNEAGYELYGFVGEGNGQAVPFAFLFTTSTDGTALEGAKTRLLSDILKYLNQRCPNLMFTLSDKEPAEINASRAEIPQAKHQLCYWHGIKYVGERLAEDRPPAHYDPRRAHAEYSFIDPTWAPGVSSGWTEDDDDGDGDGDGDGPPVPDDATPPSTCLPPVFVWKKPTT
jgi:hypothetical protein